MSETGDRQRALADIPPSVRFSFGTLAPVEVIPFNDQYELDASLYGMSPEALRTGDRHQGQQPMQPPGATKRS